MLFMMLLAFGLVLVGAVVGIWAGFVVCFLGGLADLYRAWQADPTPFELVALGVAKIALAGPVGHIVSRVAMWPGARLLKRLVYR